MCLGDVDPSKHAVIWIMEVSVVCTFRVEILVVAFWVIDRMVTVVWHIFMIVMIIAYQMMVHYKIWVVMLVLKWGMMLRKMYIMSCWFIMMCFLMMVSMIMLMVIHHVLLSMDVKVRSKAWCIFRCIWCMGSTMLQLLIQLLIPVIVVIRLRHLCRSIHSVRGVIMGEITGTIALLVMHVTHIMHTYSSNSCVSRISVTCC